MPLLTACKATFVKSCRLESQRTGKTRDRHIGGHKIYTVYIYIIWVFPKIGVPQNGWFIMENPIKMDGLGVSLFLKHLYIDIRSETYVIAYM